MTRKQQDAISHINDAVAQINQHNRFAVGRAAFDIFRALGANKFDSLRAAVFCTWHGKITLQFKDLDA